MTYSFFKLNRAALFREWRTSRTWLLWVGFVGILVPVGNLVSMFIHAGQGTLTRAAFWYTLLPAVYGYHYSNSGSLPPTSYFHPYSDPTISTAWTFVAIIIGSMPWSTDKMSDSLYSALTLPITRTQIVRYKISLALAIVLGIQFLRAMEVFMVNGWAGTPISWHLLASWWISNTLCMLVAFSTAFLLASLISYWVTSALMAVVSLFIPFAIASFLDKVVGHTSTSPYVVASIGGPTMLISTPPGPFGWLKALSPLKFVWTATAGGGTRNGIPQPISFNAGTHYLFMAGWLWLFWAVWVCAALWLTFYLFNRAPAENMVHFFTFPQMWNMLIGVVSPFIGYLIATKSHLTTTHGVAFFISTLAWSCVVYITVLLLRSYREKWR